MLRTDLARDHTFQMRFRREAQNSAVLNHPGIAAVEPNQAVRTALPPSATPPPARRQPGYCLGNATRCSIVNREDAAERSAGWDVLRAPGPGRTCTCNCGRWRR
jgi:hypothetical protein